jgi:hypothetical protein
MYVYNDKKKRKGAENMFAITSKNHKTLLILHNYGILYTVNIHYKIKPDFAILLSKNTWLPFTLPAYISKCGFYIFSIVFLKYLWLCLYHNSILVL